MIHKLDKTDAWFCQVFMYIPVLIATCDMFYYVHVYVWVITGMVYMYMYMNSEKIMGTCTPVHILYMYTYLAWTNALHSDCGTMD